MSRDHAQDHLEYIYKLRLWEHFISYIYTYTRCTTFDILKWWEIKNPYAYSESFNPKEQKNFLRKKLSNFCMSTFSKFLCLDILVNNIILICQEQNLSSKMPNDECLAQRNFAGRHWQVNCGITNGIPQFTWCEMEY